MRIQNEKRNATDVFKTVDGTSMTDSNTASAQVAASPSGEIGEINLSLVMDGFDGLLGRNRVKRSKFGRTARKQRYVRSQNGNQEQNQVLTSQDTTAEERENSNIFSLLSSSLGLSEETEDTSTKPAPAYTEDLKDASTSFSLLRDELDSTIRLAKRRKGRRSRRQSQNIEQQPQDSSHASSSDISSHSSGSELEGDGSEMNLDKVDVFENDRRFREFNGWVALATMIDDAIERWQLYNRIYE